MTDDQVQYWNKRYTTEELLALALNMLDEAASREQRSKKRWLTNNLTLEVIRARVKDYASKRIVA